MFLFCRGDSGAILGGAEPTDRVAAAGRLCRPLPKGNSETVVKDFKKKMSGPWCVQSSRLAWVRTAAAAPEAAVVDWNRGGRGVAASLIVWLGKARSGWWASNRSILAHRLARPAVNQTFARGHCIIIR